MYRLKRRKTSIRDRKDEIAAYIGENLNPANLKTVLHKYTSWILFDPEFALKRTCPIRPIYRDSFVLFICHERRGNLCISLFMPVHSISTTKTPAWPPRGTHGYWGFVAAVDPRDMACRPTLVDTPWHLASTAPLLCGWVWCVSTTESIHQQRARAPWANSYFVINTNSSFGLIYITK